MFEEVSWSGFLGFTFFAAGAALQVDSKTLLF